MAYHDMRKLDIRWNDKAIWSRWLNPVHSMVRAVVPPHSVEEHGNLLTLSNSGAEPLLLDAVWVEPLQKGSKPFYVAAEDAEGLNRQDSAWIRTVSLRLPLLMSAFHAEEFSPVRAGPPPQTPAELEPAWREAAARFQSLQAAGHPAARELEVWHRRLGQAVARGMMPGVQVGMPHGSNPESCLNAAVYVYGNLIHSWVLPRNTAGFAAAETLRSQHPETEVLVHFHPRETHWPVLLPRIPGHYHSHLFRDVTNRVAFFNGELDAGELAASGDFIMSLRSTFNGYIQRQQTHQSDRVHAMLAEHLMNYDRAAVAARALVRPDRASPASGSAHAPGRAPPQNRYGTAKPKRASVPRRTHGTRRRLGGIHFSASCPPSHGTASGGLRRAAP